MKKAILLALTLISIAFTACTRQYTCKCEYSVNDVVLGSDSRVVEGKKAEAEDECNADDVEYTYLGVTDRTECEIQ